MRPVKIWNNRKYIWYLIKKPFISFSKEIGYIRFFSLLIAIFSTYAAYKAVVIGRTTLEHADEQFVANSKTSDSLFNIQLKHSRTLNDSLVGQIHGLQEITRKQMLIINEQLIISRSYLNAQLFSTRPIIQVISNAVEDTNAIYDGIFSPRFLIRMHNNGNRPALKLIVRHFIMYDNFNKRRYGNVLVSESSTIEPDGHLEKHFLPKIPTAFKNNFYYFYDISYYDDILQRTFRQSYFLHYFPLRGKNEIASCNNEEKRIILEKINPDLKIINQPLLVDE